MLNFCSLYSGSTGNSLFVKSENTNLLIDAGESAKKIEKALQTLDIPIEDLDGILITHEHSDHVKGLGTLSKKYNIPVYANKETWSAMATQRDKIKEQNQKNFVVEENFEIGDIKIKPFSIPHDAINPCGFNLFHEKSKISIATDLGHMTKEIFENLEASSFVMLESNYDPEILKCCSYPYLLKTRILGPKGHLSNILAGKTITRLIDSGLKSVMLGHLSKENNFPELAYETVIEQLKQANYSESSIDLEVASRLTPSEMIAIS